MAKLSDQVKALFSVYVGAINDEVTFTYVVNATADMLGQQKDVVKIGDWKCGAGFKLRATDSRSLQLPPNNACTPLYYFALRINEVCVAGKFIVNASIPEVCVAFIEQSRIKAHEQAKKNAELAKKDEEEKVKASMSLKDVENANPIKEQA